MKNNVNRLVKLSVLSALGLLLMLLVRFPIIPTAPFLEYEPGDIPILIGTFLFGPKSGLIITAIVSLVQGFTVSAGSGWIGALMHLIATGSMVIVAGTIYKKMHTLKGAIIALVCGSLTMTLVMIPLNLVFTTMFLGVPLAAVKSMIVPAIIPFNLIKTSINSIVTGLVYKSVGKVLKVDIKPTLKETQKAS
ncbi:riboflavin transporter RibU [Clostridium acetireducens DSM 10703]|jgi:riboflavin transporter FmnP|uniref:Riboflavin transporter n=1 Tax=Clostridium acetireducens DSM 10703 TaxID=1121290 RepID=A0A1E8EXK6_9CLOT|nr:ECF transporter S component [Clostridium acetireducens]OFI05533.1 riboflavin transporter RibU [Clostridium acetireducens DSM 10703]